ncbi:type II toxin-antitoxin system Phd/YefM family antitoxin [Hippea alviniae]|uniref:type II toxin-antitoxin system Phd/YefM family antitoxin n=1 Tax=Hippea alviniae TaxID=1279027 RepID=UPI0003B4D440|nr:type II toxin-antitoxin system Phd/YefM family antitoxin [Hippea alviniae]
MKFITVRDLRTSPAKIWKELPEEQEMVITNNGKPIALLTPIGDSNLEETLSSIRQARAMNAVKLMQQISLKKGNDKMSIDEIEEEIRKARQESR